MKNKKGIKMTKELLREELNKFLNDEEIKNLQKYIKNIKEEENSKFNIFKVLKLDNHEIRHSNFLAWLLNPNENHNLGDKFLKRFLEEANIDTSNIDTTSMNIKTEVCTNEQRRIDLLLYTNDFVCVIENKYGSIEHGGQCQDYKKFIEKYSKFKDYNNQKYIFLDINLPTEEQLTKALNCYNPITYKEVYYILLDLLKSMNQNDNATQSIKQYTDILKEKYTMLDKETKNKCREIYSKYKDVFNLMKEYTSEFQNDIFDIMREVVKDEKMNLQNADAKDFGYNGKNYCVVRFIPKEIINNESLKISNNITNYSLFFALEFKEKLVLSIYSIKPENKWINHFKKDIEIFSKSNDEIISTIETEINSLREKFNSIAQSK